MDSSTPLELKISFWQKVFSLAATILALFLFLGRFLWAMWHAPRGFDAVSLVLTVVIGGSMLWWIYGGAQRMWLEAGLYLHVDSESVIVWTRSRRRTLLWEEIYGFTTDNKSTRGTVGDWLSLRGRDDEVLAQWDRNWCRFAPQQIKRADEIEGFIKARLRAMGLPKGEGNEALRLWESLNPISSGAPLEVKTNYSVTGWITLIFCTGCAYFCWNAPKGGPIGGSIFLLFALLGAYLIAAESTFRVGENVIEGSSMFGRNRLEWSEVTAVNIDELGRSLVFEGGEKRFVAASPMNWKNKGKQEMLLFLAAMCEKRHIPFDKRAKPNYGGSKNVKVQR